MKDDVIIVSGSRMWMPSSARSMRVALCVSLMVFFYKLGDHTGVVVLDAGDIDRELRTELNNALWFFAESMPYTLYQKW